MTSQLVALNPLGNGERMQKRYLAQVAEQSYGSMEDFNYLAAR